MNKHGNLQDNRYKVHEVKSLKKMPFPDLARDLLERLVLATQPLMVRQQWRVGQFMEFYPKNGGLLGLNVNAGSRIMIRLRSPQNQQTFLPFESLLGTMVHELVHNAIGEHSFDFYQLVDRLTDEVQRDMHQMRQSGLNPYEVKTAAPFDWSKSQGRKLGSAVAGSAGCGSIQDYLLHGTATATATTAATTRSKPPLTQRPPPPARGSSGSGGSGGGAAVNRPLPTANTTATTVTATTTATTRGSTSTSATSADWIRQQRLQALARQGVTDVFTHDRPTRPHRPPIAPATAPPPPSPLPLPAASQPPIVVVDLPWSATLTQPLAAPTTRDTAGANRANKAAASAVTATITTAATAATVATVVILDDIGGGGTPTSPRLTGTKRAFHPTTLVDGDGYDNVIDLSSSPPLSRTTTATAAAAAAASVPPQRQPPQPIDLLDDDDDVDDDEPDTQPVLIDEEPDTQPVLLDGAVDDAVDDADAVVWCAPCTPLVIDLIALGLDDDDDDDEGDDDGGRDEAFTGPVSSSSAS